MTIRIPESYRSRRIDHEPCLVLKQVTARIVMIPTACALHALPRLYGRAAEQYKRLGDEVEGLKSRYNQFSFNRAT